MQIGIISMQRVINYGSYLQAYALKSMIESLGHSVYFVDIQQGDRLVKKNSLNKAVVDRMIVKRVEHVLYKKLRGWLFQEIYFPQIGINRPAQEEECDWLVIGSDEVFNCCQPVKWGVSYQLFGDVSRPAITYAASCGYTTLEGVKKLEITDRIRDSLKKLKAISVRDSNTELFVRELIGVKVPRHLDPVLVYNWDRMIPKVHRRKPYILVYAYDNRINTRKEIDMIKKFARARGCQLVSFGLYQRWCDHNVLCSPLELISYYDAAEYVITDTFHGTVLSIKRNRPFSVIIRDSNKNKLRDLLEQFHLSERAVSDLNRFEETASQAIDYHEVNRIIKIEAERSMEYLRIQLGGHEGKTGQG